MKRIADMTPRAMADAPSTNGRTPRGQFATGNPGGPGNPYARRTAALRSALLDAVTEADIRAIAKAGGGVSIALLERHASVARRLTEQQFAYFTPIVELSGSDLSAVRECVALADAFASGSDSKAGADKNKTAK